MLEAKGTNGTLRFDGQTVHIERKGLAARALVGGGSKSIPVASINAVQWRKAGITGGFIQFTISGGSELRSRSGHHSRDAQRDENSVTFHTGQQPAFEQIHAAIQAAIANRHAPQAAYAPAPAAAPSIADEIAKLAALRDQGIISPADFEAGKNKLLGL